MRTAIDKLGKVAVTVEKDYWSNKKTYDKLTIVEKKGVFGTYVSRKPVPAGIDITNREYWIPFSSLKEEIVLKFNELVSGVDNLKTTVDEKEAELYNAIASIIAGGVALKQSLGDSEVFGISQKKITEEFADVRQKTADDDATLQTQITDNDTHIRNIADEEDVTMVTVDEQPTIKLKDKTYEPEKYSGLGRKYLRKNIIYDVNIVHFGGFVENVAIQKVGAVITDGNSSNVVYDRIRKAFLYKEEKDLLTPIKYYNVWTSEEVPYSDYYQSSFSEGYTIRTDVVFMFGDVPYHWDENDQELAVLSDFYESHSKNILTQAMINEPNTIYHIQYDYDLNGQTITVPEGCTLEFEGGSLRNGTLIGQNTTITTNRIYQVFYNVKIDNNFINEQLNVILFGIWPNRRDIDASIILKNNIEGYKGKIFFPKGSYYFSEYHYTNTNKDNLFIQGDVYGGLSSKTYFYPFYDSQYYIFKIGGSKYTLDGTNIAWDIVINDIHFCTPFGYTPKNLSVNYGYSDVEYPHSALVLDAIGKGRFGIGGSVHNTPLVTFGYIGECTFDYVVCYSLWGKSSLPVINIVTSANKAITASRINRLECETICGPVIKSNGVSYCSELYINSFNYEGTVNWLHENISNETRYSTPIEYKNYTTVPIFDINYFIGIYINYMSITSCNNTWNNSLDDDPEKLCARTFFKSTRLGYTFTINNVENNFSSKYCYIEGSSHKQYAGTLCINNVKSVKFIYDTDTKLGLYIRTDTENFLEGKVTVESTIYKQNNLYKLKNVSLPDGYVTRRPTGELAYYCSYNTYILNKDGFIVPEDAIETIIDFEKFGSTNIIFSLEYYDTNDSLIKEEQSSVNKIKGVISLPINRGIDFSYLKIKYPTNGGYQCYIYSIAFISKYDVSISKSELATKGYIYKRKGIESLIYNTPKVISNPSSTGKTIVIEQLLNNNNLLYVRFLKEENWESENMQYTLPAFTKQMEIIVPDSTIYKYIGFKTAFGGMYINILEAVLQDVKLERSALNLIDYGYDNISYPSLSGVPKIEDVPVGFKFFNMSLNKCMYSNGTKWVDEKGYTAAISKGTTDKRPTASLVADDAGYEYFDTTLGKPIYFNGTAWVDATGAAV